MSLEAAEGHKQVFEFCSAHGVECWQHVAQFRHTYTNNTNYYLNIALALNT
jgi:hypothetical protein